MKTDFQPNINLSFIRGGLAHVGVKNTLYENWCIFNRVNLENKFYLPVHGKGEIFINGTHYKLEKYKWFLIGEGEVRSYYTTSGNELEKYVVHFYSDAGNEPLKKVLDLPDFIPLNEDEYKDVLNMMKNFSGDYTFAPANLYDFFQNKSKLYSLLYYYAELAASKGLHRTNHNAPASKIQLMIMQYVFNKDMKNPDTKKLAATLGMTENYFSKYFKKVFYSPIQQLIYKNRMFAALEAVTMTDEAIDDIAKKCGFEHTTYFYKIFKKQTGMTPVQFRKKYSQFGFFSTEPNFEYKKQKRLKSNEIYSFKP